MIELKLAILTVLAFALYLLWSMFGTVRDEHREAAAATAHEDDGRPAKLMRRRLEKITEQNWND